MQALILLAIICALLEPPESPLSAGEWRIYAVCSIIGSVIIFLMFYGAMHGWCTAGIK